MEYITSGSEDFGHNAIVRYFPEKNLRIAVLANTLKTKDGVTLSKKISKDIYQLFQEEGTWLKEYISHGHACSLPHWKLPRHWRKCLSCSKNIKIGGGLIWARYHRIVGRFEFKLLWLQSQYTWLKGQIHAVGNNLLMDKVQ